MAVSAEVTAFLEDLGENLAIIENALVRLEDSPGNQEYLHEIFRAAHTIKGNAAMMNLGNLVALGHALETALQEVLAGNLGASPHTVGVFHECRAAMLMIADALRSGSDSRQVSIRPLTDQIQVLLLSTAPVQNSGMGRTVTVTLNISAAEQAPSVRAFLAETRLTEFGTIIRKEPADDVLETPQFAASERKLTFVLQTAAETDEIRANLNIDLVENVQVSESAARAPGAAEPLKVARETAGGETGTGKASAQQEISTGTADTIRLSVHTLDQLLNLTGELVIANSGLVSLSERAARTGTDADFAIELSDKSREIFRVAAEIQNIVMKSRMLPLEHVFSRFRRFVRDYSDKSGKAIRLEIAGAETELDKRVIDEMVKPLTHLIRNALDHGIEESAERITAGKPPEGTLRLAASQSGSSILITVEDDGRGLNVARIIERAVSRNLVSPERAASLSLPEVYEFIFAPGFSTKESADELSGRGFGMDIVRDSIHKLSGDLQLFSEPGKGTRMVVKLPLTLAILTALTVRVRNDLFAFPLSTIEESIEIPSGSVMRVDGRDILHWRDQILPFLRLDNVLGYPPIEETREHFYAIIAEIHRTRIAIGVDEFLQKRELVIKSLAEHYQHVPGLSGASMLGDNEIVFILDVEEIARMHANRYTRITEPAATPAWEKNDRQSESLSESAVPAATVSAESDVTAGNPEPSMKPLFDFSDKELMRKWIAQSNKTAVQGIQMLTGNQAISVKKSRGSRVKAERSGDTMAKITARADDILLIHLPMLPAAGAIDLIMEKKSAERMASLLFKAAGFESMEEFDPSPLLEITNILGSAYTNTLTFLTEKSVEPATPSLLSTREAIEELMDERRQSPKSEMLVVENQFHIDDEDIQVELMIYLTGE
ncbi:MAG: chemotaxis protein CheW [Spirochaetota bacterium]